MATRNEFDCLDEEVRELLQNYKHKRATTYEPCTSKNYKECLIGLSEEFGLLNINYIFNPHIDIVNNTLTAEALVNLINCVWTLLHYHKNLKEKVERLVEHDNILEHNNKLLQGSIKRLKDQLTSHKNEARSCVASAQKISDRSDDMLHNLTETQNKLKQLLKQKETTEKSYRNEVTRLKLLNDKLTDRLRNKSDSHTPCSEICDASILQLKERDRKQRAMIAQLQQNNHKLLNEVVAMKEELILGGLHEFNIGDKK